LEVAQKRGYVQTQTAEDSLKRAKIQEREQVMQKRYGGFYQEGQKPGTKNKPEPGELGLADENNEGEEELGLADENNPPKKS